MSDESKLVPGTWLDADPNASAIAGTFAPLTATRVYRCAKGHERIDPGGMIVGVYTVMGARAPVTACYVCVMEWLAATFPAVLAEEHDWRCDAGAGCKCVEART